MPETRQGLSPPPKLRVTASSTAGQRMVQADKEWGEQQKSGLSVAGRENESASPAIDENYV